MEKSQKLVVLLTEVLVFQESIGGGGGGPFFLALGLAPAWSPLSDFREAGFKGSSISGESGPLNSSELRESWWESAENKEHKL